MSNSLPICVVQSTFSATKHFLSSLLLHLSPFMRPLERLFHLSLWYDPRPFRSSVVHSRLSTGSDFCIWISYFFKRTF